MDSQHKGGLAILMALGKGKPPMGGGGGDEMPPPDHAGPDGDEMPDGSEADAGYSIKMPEGYQPPDGTNPGQGFDATIRAHVDDDGMLCIDSVDGIPTHKGGDAGAEETEPADESAGEDTDGGEAADTGEATGSDKPPPSSGMEPDAGKAMAMAAKKMSNSRKRY